MVTHLVRAFASLSTVQCQALPAEGRGPARAGHTTRVRAIKRVRVQSYNDLGGRQLPLPNFSGMADAPLPWAAIDGEADDGDGAEEEEDFGFANIEEVHIPVHTEFVY